NIQLDLSVLHAPAEDVCEYPTPRGIGGEPRPELLGVSDGHILNADAELDARALSFLKLQDRTAGNDALVGAPRYLADVDCAEACIGVTGDLRDQMDGGLRRFFRRDGRTIGDELEAIAALGSSVARHRANRTVKVPGGASAAN